VNDDVMVLTRPSWSTHEYYNFLFFTVLILLGFTSNIYADLQSFMKQVIWVRIMMF
jgi:hypothetical protein